MPDKTSPSPEIKARRSSIAASLLALSSGGTTAAAITALQDGSIPLAAALGAYAVTAVALAVMASRAAYRWMKLAKAELRTPGDLPADGGTRS